MYATSSDGSSIYYEIEGSGDPPILFVYGAGCFIEHWQFQRTLAATYQLIFCDLAGHGKSSSNRDTYTMKAFGQDVSAVIEHANLDNVILVGWSMGGPVVLEAALDNPQVIGIIGVDTFFPWEASGYPRISGYTLREMNNYLDRFRTNDQEAFFRAYTNWLGSFFNLGKKVDDDVKRQILELGKKVSPKVFVSEIEELHRWDVLETAQKVSQPIRTIMAALSVPHPDYRKKFTKEENGKVEFNAVFIEDVSHILMVQKPHEFNTVLLSVIEELT